jgi:hypothetical protein
MTKIVINGDFGGFSLSYEGMMRYGELTGRPLFAFVDARPLNFTSGCMVPYTASGEEAFCIHYSTQPLDEKQNIVTGTYVSPHYLKRDDPHLIQVVEELGEKADGRCAHLKVVEIPDGIEWEIDEYDGSERVDEKHRSWD